MAPAKGGGKPGAKKGTGNGKNVKGGGGGGKGKQDKRGIKESSSGSSVSGGIGERRLPANYFRPLIAVNIIMGIVLGILALCSIDPEDCNLIPGVGEYLADQSSILAALFGVIMLINLIMTLQVMKLCKKHRLDGKTTNKWLGQTLISGPFSWKALKQADASVSPPPNKPQQQSPPPEPPSKTAKKK